jgi:hypothetical protein
MTKPRNQRRSEAAQTRKLLQKISRSVCACLADRTAALHGRDMPDYSRYLDVAGVPLVLGLTAWRGAALLEVLRQSDYARLATLQAFGDKASSKRWQVPAESGALGSMTRAESIAVEEVYRPWPDTSWFMRDYLLNDALAEARLSNEKVAIADDVLKFGRRPKTHCAFVDKPMGELVQGQRIEAVSRCMHNGDQSRLYTGCVFLVAGSPVLLQVGWYDNGTGRLEENVTVPLTELPEHAQVVEALVGILHERARALNERTAEYVRLATAEVGS